MCCHIDCLCHTQGGSALVPDKLRAQVAMLGWEGEGGYLPFLSCHLATLLVCHFQPSLETHLPHLNGDISEGHIPENH